MDESCFFAETGIKIKLNIVTCVWGVAVGVPMFISLPFSSAASGSWLYDTQHNNIQPNDTQYKDTQHNI